MIRVILLFLRYINNKLLVYESFLLSQMKLFTILKSYFMDNLLYPNVCMKKKIDKEVDA